MNKKEIFFERNILLLVEKLSYWGLRVCGVNVDGNPSQGFHRPLDGIMRVGKEGMLYV